MDGGALVFLDYGWWILGLQSLPLVHFCLSRHLDPCHRTGYSMLYLMVVFMMWILAIMLPEIAGVSWPVSVLLLLAPLLLWVYPFTTGRRVESEFGGVCRRCDTPPGKSQTR